MKGSPQAALLAWFDRHRRDLPWRHTRDPYAIWISEVMLQQTQVATVIPYYQRFLDRFPTVRALAEAPLSDVLSAWRGLGYYSRARSLHRAAGEVARAGSHLPRTAEGLRALPGFGRYTAGAVASIAFGERTPVVDGNVARVLARHRGILDDLKAPAVRERLWVEAGSWLPDARPGDFNQALMELGALICTPRNPTCLLCPIAGSCEGRRKGVVDKIPAAPARRARKTLVLAAALVRRGEKLLVARRAETGLFGGLWELPTAEADGEGARVLETIVREQVGLRLKTLREVAQVRRTLTHRDLTIRVYECERIGGRLAPRGSYVEAGFKTPADLAGLGMATAMVSAVEAIPRPKNR